MSASTRARGLGAYEAWIPNLSKMPACKGALPFNWEDFVHDRVAFDNCSGFLTIPGSDPFCGNSRQQARLLIEQNIDTYCRGQAAGVSVKTPGEEKEAGGGGGGDWGFDPLGPSTAGTDVGGPVNGQPSALAAMLPLGAAAAAAIGVVILAKVFLAKKGAA